MFLDLDHFKIVNDSCGHFAGDELLRQVGSIIKSSVRSFDTVARLGGDEFAVMLENCSAGQGEIIARDICSAMEHYRYLAPNGQGYRVGVSIGVASIDLAGHSLEHLLQAADNACYAAKTEGRSRHHVWSPEDGGIQSRAGETAWGVEVERALDADAFEIYAQRLEPRSTRALSHAPGMACEILVRMHLPDGRLVAPGAFMHAAERYQLASLIDRWVVQAVFNLFSDDADHARGVTHIGINLSGQSIGDTSFHDFVRGVVERARFDVGIVCFEITETAAITNLAAASLFLNDMRNRGIRIALDDFGAGFSSFGYLKSLCVDYLKIDGQFVTGVASSPIDRVSVKSFCEVARVLGIETIAEYVEDGETLRVLDELGVDYAQGYYVHVPEPILDLLAASAAGAY
jgi:diguanylate cyclase (GGDEF)-like protein